MFVIDYKPGNAVRGLALGLAALSLPAVAAENMRARDLGIPFDGQPGALNAITDVAGVEVGHVTLVEGDGRLEVGNGPVRTGVTVVHPRGKTSTEGVFAGWFTLNASGEMTGTTWLEERGLIDGPIGITNTHSVGVVRDAAVAWMVRQGWKADWHAPVVAETYDGALNDINGFHVTRDHALAAMERAATGPVAEGAIGGGTGMVCNGFKGGIGTASRKIEINGENFIVVVATDAPLLPHQLTRVAKRPSLALGRLGAVSTDGSGDIFVAFSTANAGRLSESDFSKVDAYPNDELTTVFAATVQATEEAIVNAMVGAETTVGASGFRVPEMPEDLVRSIFRDTAE